MFLVSFNGAEFPMPNQRRNVSPPNTVNCTVRKYLTAREISVVELIAQGMRNKEIGAQLGIAADTVEAHLRNIFEKLRVHDRTAAVTVAIRRGMIHLK